MSKAAKEKEYVVCIGSNLAEKVLAYIAGSLHEENLDECFHCGCGRGESHSKDCYGAGLWVELDGEIERGNKSAYDGYVARVRLSSPVKVDDE